MFFYTVSIHCFCASLLSLLAPPPSTFPHCLKVVPPPTFFPLPLETTPPLIQKKKTPSVKFALYVLLIQIIQQHFFFFFVLLTFLPRHLQKPTPRLSPSDVSPPLRSGNPISRPCGNPPPPPPLPPPYRHFHLITQYPPPINPLQPPHPHLQLSLTQPTNPHRPLDPPLIKSPPQNSSPQKIPTILKTPSPDPSLLDPSHSINYPQTSNPLLLNLH